MKTQASQIRLQFNSDMKPELIITLKSREGLESLNDLKCATDKGKLLDCEIKVHRERRSLDSNGYLWVLLGKMAAVLKTSKDELYLQMLKRYSLKFTYIVVMPEAVETLKSIWREVEEKGKGVINGRECVQLLCYYGSSSFNTEEMSVLIEGVVSEAKEIGIETMTPQEIARMNEQWGR